MTNYADCFLQRIAVLAICFVCLVWQAITVAAPQLSHIQEFIHCFAWWEQFLHNSGNLYARKARLEHYGSELPATILTTCVWLLPSGSSYHTMSAAPTITRKYSNFGRGCLCPIVIPQGILFPYADESYTPTIHYANLSNECSTPERMPREFCRNSKMHPSWHTIEFHFCLPGIIIVMWVVIINLYLINEWSNSWNSSVLH